MAEKSDDKKEAIIIKKIFKSGGGHHGGAWKVAYADFVTAMMAFFLLLWLLSTTTPEQRQGIAEYFTPTMGLKDAKGIGFQGGMTPNEPGTSKSTLSQPGLVAGQVQPGPLPKEPTPVQETAPPQETNGEASGMAIDSNAEKKDDTPAAQNAKDNTDEDQLKKAKEEVLSAFDNTPDLQKYKTNVTITNTPEGMKIDLVDDDRNALFNPGSATITDMGHSMLRAIGAVILRTTNQVTITGHTESITYPPGTQYTNWELSTDRANAARRFLSQNIVEPDRIIRTAGMADHELFLPKEPQSPRNRRISLLLLRNSHMAAHDTAPTERGMLSVPETPAQAPAPAAPATVAPVPAASATTPANPAP